MGLISPYVYKDKQRNLKWWLHARAKKKMVFYYFSKDQTGALMDIPPGYEVMVNERTGMPLLRKTGRKKKKEA